MRRYRLTWVMLTIVLGIAVFYTKYEVQSLEDDLTSINQKILHHQQSLDVLAAEWSYLNRPDYLAALAKKHLRLQPAQPTQVVDLARVPGLGDNPAMLTGFSTTP